MPPSFPYDKLNNWVQKTELKLILINLDECQISFRMYVFSKCGFKLRQRSCRKMETVISKVLDDESR